MAENTVKGQKKPNTAGSEYNALQFMIQQALNSVSTAIPVQVQAVSGLFVDVLPLVSSVDGYGNAVEPTTLFHLPVFRYHAGVGAVILDPVVGDKGLAVFAQADASNVNDGTGAPQQPASFRKHSMSDGFYIGGFHNAAPTVYVEIKQSGEVVIVAPNKLTVTSPTATFSGNVTMSGNLSVTGDANIGGISFAGHVHGGVEAGSDLTSTPQ
jgi:hypothetical protein